MYVHVFRLNFLSFHSNLKTLSLQGSKWTHWIINLRYTIKLSYFGWILQFPLFQQIAYFAIFLELYEIDLQYKKMRAENRMLAKQFPESPDKDAVGDKSKNIAKDCNRLNQKKTRVMNDFLQMKLYEAFLEASPQAILQIMIVFSRGFSDPMDVFTITTSMLSLTMCATNLYWKYPTLVSIFLIDVFSQENILIEVI